MKTKNFTFLQDKVAGNILYPDTERLKILLDIVTIQSFLPPALFENGKQKASVASARLTANYFTIGSLLTGAGVGLFFILLCNIEKPSFLSEL